MAYLALYRKYRSQSFGELAGQEHVTTGLQNAIKSGRVAHAYLFCGPRGCGKTSTARLLARALNCVEGPTPEPCGVCHLCVDIKNGSCLDVVELDAASETGIDDVREKIVENAKFAPGQTRFKVYIIDEVHDLSQKAFDSLLKTIEEPPPHVIFILATTEAHKVPITIRSRCQRMDFKRGTLQDLTTNLHRVLDSEGVSYDAEAVAAVAQAAEGSFRDSLSILEQVLAYSDGQLTAEAVMETIGSVDASTLGSLLEVVSRDDLGAVTELAGALIDSGKDVRQLFAALQAYLRDLMVARVAPNNPALAIYTGDRHSQLTALAQQFRPDQVLQMVRVIGEQERLLRFSNQHRLILEVALWSLLPSQLAARTTVTPVAQAPVQRPSAGDRPAPPPRAAQPVPAAAPSTQEAPIAIPANIDLDVLRRLWPRVVNRLVKKYPSAGTYISADIGVLSLQGHVIELGFPTKFAMESADRPARREAIERALAEELGQAGFKVRCAIASAETPVASAPPEPLITLSEEQANPPEGLPAFSGQLSNGGGMQGQSVSDDPYISLVLSELNGTLVEP